MRDIRNRILSGERQWKIAKRYGVTQPTIAAIKTGRTWAHITDHQETPTP